MSRCLVPVATIASIIAGIIACELASPGFWGLMLDGAIVGIERATSSLLTALVIAGFLLGLGYLICLIKHAPAIRDAGVERRHEPRIRELRAENLRLVGVVRELRDGGRWN